MVATSMGDDDNLDPNTDDGPLSAGDDPLAGKPAGSAHGLTPGQRLAAKQAQKAELKREFKAELKQKADEQRVKEDAEAEKLFGRSAEAPAAPDNVQRAAVEFSSYLQGHRAALIGAVIGVLAIGVAFIYGRKAISSGSLEQTQLLASAAAIANGGIDPSNTTGADAEGKPAYKTVEARDRAAIDAYTKAASEAPKSLAAGWAKLGEAAASVALGRFDDAAKLFEAVYTSHRADPTIAVRALEGLALSLEAAGKTDAAAQRFDELKALDKGQGSDFADYHLARLKLAKGERDAAKTLLKGVYDRLVEAAAKGEKNAYLKGEVEVRLAELDSSLVPNLGTGSADPGQMSQEELQRLIEQLQRKGGLPAAGE